MDKEETSEIILERVPNSRTPIAQKEKYLVPRNLTVGGLIHKIKKTMILHPDTSLFLLCKNGTLQSSLTMGELLDEERDEDGFLYLCYLARNSYSCTREAGRIL